MEVRKLNKDEAKWYGVTEEHFLISIENKNWFPTKKIAGVNKHGKFYDKHNIGLHIGGNMGSAYVAVKDLEKTRKLLGQD